MYTKIMVPLFNNQCCVGNSTDTALARVSKIYLLGLLDYDDFNDMTMMTRVL